MSSVAPNIIIESGIDWPAIIASISTGIAAVAGIGGTVWQASRNWNHDDKKAKLSEKRHIYANCLAAFNTGIRAAVLKQAQQELAEKIAGRAEEALKQAEVSKRGRDSIEALGDELNSAIEKRDIQNDNWIDAVQTSAAAYYELMLIAPDNVKDSAGKVMNEINRYPKPDVKPPQMALARAISGLMEAMRTDLGESPLSDTTALTGAIPLS